MKHPLRTLIGGAFALLACGGTKSTPADRAPSPKTATASVASPRTIDPDDPKACAPCHAAVVAEWEESMHARAHESRDPVFAGLRTLRIAHEGPEIAEECALCHYPRPQATTDPKIAARGVTCASCHAVAELHRERGPGAKALEWTTVNRMAGPHNLSPGLSPVHGTGPAPDFITDGSSLCLACHASATNQHGVVTCNTGAEWSEVDQKLSCVSCHMPTLPGPAGEVSSHRADHRSHAFLGPHRAWYQDDPSFLASAVALSVTREGAAVVITLDNRSHHSFPSGFPGRSATVVAVGRDASGEVVWHSAPNSPIEDTPHAVLMQRYVDGAGAPVPAFLAVKLAADTRLRATETRELRLGGVPPSAQEDEVKLLYSLLPPPLAAKIGVDGPEAAPKVILTETARR